MDIPSIRVRPGGGAVSVRVTDPTHPQSVAGVVWVYDSEQNPKGSAGQFGTDGPEVILGSAASIGGFFFQAEGAVLAQGDDPPSPYQVVITVLQDETALHRETPPNGTGTVGDANQPFVYAFRIVSA
ncbi:MAG TPA: hypothetical protein VFJ82_21605 [Longimicrobium sp.]|nr:hypothetical protein [Longimicrobium sp.]